MGLNKTTGALLARITEESYAAYENKVKAPPQDGNRGVNYLDATATRRKNDAVNNLLQFFKMQFFWATLPRDLRKAVAQHNQNTITLDDMFQVLTDTQRESGAKASWPEAAVNEDSHSEAKDDEDKVAAFQNRRNNRFQNRPKRQNSGAPQCSNHFNTGARSNTNRNCKYCFFCKIQNRTQEECWKRIREIKPFTDKQGCVFWPKVYVTSNGNSEQQETGAGASFSLKSLMTPLIQAPRVIPQLILSLCTILIATCYKLFEIMTPFNGDKIRPRLAVRVGNKTFSWLFDTGAAVTGMNKELFDLAFGHSKICLDRSRNLKAVLLLQETKCLSTGCLKWTYS